MGKEEWESLVGIVSEAKKDPSKKPPEGDSTPPTTPATRTKAYLSEFLSEEDSKRIEKKIGDFYAKHEKDAEKAKKADAVIQTFRKDYEKTDEDHKKALGEIDAEYKKAVSKAESLHREYVADVVKEWTEGRLSEAEKDKAIADAGAETQARYDKALEKSKADVSTANDTRDNDRKKLMDKIQTDVENAFDEPAEDKEGEGGGKTAALRVASRWLRRT